MPVLESTSTSAEASADKSEDTRIYEFCVLYPYGLPQKEEQALTKAVEAHFAETGGKQVSKDVWGRRGLAYPIKGQTEGNFVIYYYEMDPSKLQELDEALRITPGLLRHMVVKPPRGYEIVQYATRFEEWKAEEAQAEDRKAKQKEEDLQRRVAEKAKRQVKRDSVKKDEKPVEKAKPTEKRDITEQLDKLISDDDLGI